MDKPNILIFHCDQLRHDALGCNGNALARTPNIDRLAAGGTRCTRHIAANPVCMPSRASFFTGLYPPGHGVFSNGIPLNRREFIDWPEPSRGGSIDNLVAQPATTADVFADAGYDTASFGKLHLRPNVTAGPGSDPESWMNPLEHFASWNGPYYGFRHVQTTAGHGEHPATRGCHYALWLREEHRDVFDRVFQGPAEPRPVPAEPELYASSIPSELHHSRWLADQFVDYLREGREAEKPFFAFIGFPDPHHPFCPPRDLLDLFRGAPVPEPHRCPGRSWEDHPGRALLENSTVDHLSEEQQRDVIRYTYAMVHGIDLAVGRVLDALEAAGVAENTIVVFTADHGDYLCDHGLLRKTDLADDTLVRVPLIVRAPGHDLPETVNKAVSNTDVLPTLCGLADAAPPDCLHGRNIFPGGSDVEDGSAFVFAGGGPRPKLRNYTVYDRHHRLTWYPNADEHNARGHAGYIEMFDHRSDPHECHNLIRTHGRDSRTICDELIGRIMSALPRLDTPIVGRAGPY